MTLLKSDILQFACLKHTIIWNFTKFLHGLECLSPFMMGISEVSFKTLAAHTDMCCLTLCRADGLLIKYPQFPDVLNGLNVQPHNIFLLMF